MLRVAVLCSHRAPGLVAAIADDPDRGTLYDVVACVTSDSKCLDRALLEAFQVPVIEHDIHDFYRVRSARVSDLVVRRLYDRATLHLLARYRPDLIVCCGYLYILTDAFLGSLACPIVNLHHSDLCASHGDNARNYTGLHAVRDAILAGETETRSTVHLVTAAVDAGQPLLRSRAFPVADEILEAKARRKSNLLRSYIRAHEQWMLQVSWPVLLQRTFELFARHAVSPTDTMPLIDGEPGVLELDRDGSAFVVSSAPEAVAV